MDAFRKWSNCSTAIWLHGISGCGKTILTSTIIEHLRKSRPEPIVYFYFDVQDSRKRNLRQMLRALTGQLYRAHIPARAPLELLHRSTTDQPTIVQLTQCFQEMCKLSSAIIVLDALDEQQRVRRFLIG